MESCATSHCHTPHPCWHKTHADAKRHSPTSHRRCFRGKLSTFHQTRSNFKMIDQWIGCQQIVCFLSQHICSIPQSVTAFLNFICLLSLHIHYLSFFCFLITQTIYFIVERFKIYIYTDNCSRHFCAFSVVIPLTHDSKAQILFRHPLKLVNWINSPILLIHLWISEKVTLKRVVEET